PPPSPPCPYTTLFRSARVHDVHVFALGQESRRCRYQLAGAEVHNAGHLATRLQLLADVWREHRHGQFALIHAIWAAPPGALAALDRKEHTSELQSREN